MKVTEEKVKVYTPDNGKAIKLTKNGKIITYMSCAYYALPQYGHTVEEVDIEEANNFFTNNIKKIKNILKK